MQSRSLVPHSPGLQLPIANLRNVFRTRRRAQARQARRASTKTCAPPTSGCWSADLRFQVKPSGVPEMAALYDQLPNFADALDDLKRHVALAQDSGDGIEITPMLLGPPGIGKTHFARQLASCWAPA